MVGQPLVHERKRAEVVRPPRHNDNGTIVPVDDGLGDLETEAHGNRNGEADATDEWDELAETRGRTHGQRQERERERRDERKETEDRRRTNT